MDTIRNTCHSCFEYVLTQRPNLSALVLILSGSCVIGFSYGAGSIVGSLGIQACGFGLGGFLLGLGVFIAGYYHCYYTAPEDHEVAPLIPPEERNPLSQDDLKSDDYEQEYRSTLECEYGDLHLKLSRTITLMREIEQLFSKKKNEIGDKFDGKDYFKLAAPIRRMIEETEPQVPLFSDTYNRIPYIEIEALKQEFETLQKLFQETCPKVYQWFEKMKKEFEEKGLILEDPEEWNIITDEVNRNNNANKRLN